MTRAVHAVGQPGHSRFTSNRRVFLVMHFGTSPAQAPPPADPSTCTTDPTPCDPSTFCNCIQKAASCPTSGVFLTQCGSNGTLWGFGCTQG